MGPGLVPPSPRPPRAWPARTAPPDRPRRRRASRTRSARAARRRRPRRRRRARRARRATRRPGGARRASRRARGRTPGSAPRAGSNRERRSEGLERAARGQRRRPDALVGADPRRASPAAAMRAASWVRLARPRPNVAPAVAVTRRTRSSAASREAPTTMASAPAGSAAMNARAASTRSAADGDTMVRSGGVTRDGNAHPRSLRGVTIPDKPPGHGIRLGLPPPCGRGQSGQLLPVRARRVARDGEPPVGTPRRSVLHDGGPGRRPARRGRGRSRRAGRG